MIKTIILAVLLSTMVGWPIARVANAAAGTKMYDGTEPGFWDGHTIIVYRIQATEENDAHIRRLTGSVLAVLHTTKMIPTDVQVLCSDIRLQDFIPEAREVYILCLYEKDGKWYVGGSIVKFFEDWCGTEQITGLKDPALDRFVEKINSLRAKANEKVR